jgi:hypothetical protein
MTALSELLPSGGGQGEVNFVATGSISNGGPVVLNSDGTVSPVAQTAQNIPLGSEATFNSAAIDSCVVRFILTDPNKFVVCYRLQSNSYGYAVVGSISGTTISFGTPVAFKSSVMPVGVTMEMDTLVANRFLVTYSYNPGGGYNQGQAVTGVVSGTSITIGTPSAGYSPVHPSAYNNGNPRNIDLAIDPNSSVTTKFIVAFMLNDPSKKVYCRPGYINADGTISFGVLAEPRASGSIGYASNHKWPTVAFDSKSSGNGIVSWTGEGGAYSYRQAWVRPFKWATTLVFGQAIEYTTYGTYFTTYSPTMKASPFVASQYMAAYGMQYTGPFAGGANALTVNNPGSTSSTITVGPQNNFDGAAYATYPPNGAYSQERTVSLAFSRTQPDTFVVAWSKGSGSIPLRVGTLNSTTGVITYTAEDTSDTGSNEWVSIDMPVTGDISVICYQDLTNSTIGKVRLGQILVNNVFDVIGIAGSAISNGASGPVNVFGGVNTQQSGLTIGTEYYAQPDGTTSTATAFPAQRLGRAVKATTINMKDLT